MANKYRVGWTDTWDATAWTKRATTSWWAWWAAVPTSTDDVYIDINSQLWATTTDAHWISLLSHVINDTYCPKVWMIISTNKELKLTDVTVSTNTSCTQAYLYTWTWTDLWTLLQQKTITSYTATFEYALSNSTQYAIVFDAWGSGWNAGMTNTWVAPVSWTNINRDRAYHNWWSPWSQTELMAIDSIKTVELVACTITSSWWWVCTCKGLDFTWFLGTYVWGNYAFLNWWNLTFSPTMTVTSNGMFALASWTTAITQSGNVGKYTITCTNATDISLWSDLDLSWWSIGWSSTATQSFSTNDYDIICDTFGWEGVSSSGHFTFNLGSSTIDTVNRYMTFSSWSITINPDASTIKCTWNFTWWWKTYNDVEINWATSTIKGSNTFNDLKIWKDGIQTISFTDWTDQDVTTFTCIGDSWKEKTLQGTSTWWWKLSWTTWTNSVQYTKLSYSTAEWWATRKALISSGNVNQWNNFGWDFWCPWLNLQTFKNT